jgi:hypothetical protein
MALRNQRSTNQGRQISDQGKDTETGKQDGPQSQDQIHQSNEPALTIHSHKTRNTEPFDDGQQIDEPSKVVLVIVALTLIFIAVISYFVTQMPKQ